MVKNKKAGAPTCLRAIKRSFYFETFATAFAPLEAGFAAG
jgi:hypothetical protein